MRSTTIKTIQQAKNFASSINDTFAAFGINDAKEEALGSTIYFSSEEIFYAFTNEFDAKLPEMQRLFDRIMDSVIILKK